MKVQLKAQLFQQLKLGQLLHPQRKQYRQLQVHLCTLLHAHQRNLRKHPHQNMKVQPKSQQLKIHQVLLLQRKAYRPPMRHFKQQIRRQLKQIHLRRHGQVPHYIIQQQVPFLLLLTALKISSRTIQSIQLAIEKNHLHFKRNKIRKKVSLKTGCFMDCAVALF